MPELGQEERFPPTGLSAGSGPERRRSPEGRRNGRGVPKAAVAAIQNDFPGPVTRKLGAIGNPDLSVDGADQRDPSRAREDFTGSTSRYPAPDVAADRIRFRCVLVDIDIEFGAEQRHRGSEAAANHRDPERRGHRYRSE